MKRKSSASALSMSAGDIVSALQQELGLSLADIAAATGISRTGLSCYSNGLRKANEIDYRKLAVLAIERGVAK